MIIYHKALAKYQATIIEMSTIVLAHLVRKSRYNFEIKLIIRKYNYIQKWNVYVQLQEQKYNYLQGHTGQLQNL